MKTKIKLFIIFILGVIVFSSITFVAAKDIFASSIKYKETTVEGAIDDLYLKTSNSVLSKVVLRQQIAVVGPSNKSTDAFYFNDSIVNGYKYFKITEKTTNSNADNCVFKAKTVDTSTTEVFTEETEYNTTDYTHMWSEITSKSTTSSTDYARCYYYIECYN